MNGAVLPLGNVLDGVLIDNVVGVTVGGANVLNGDGTIKTLNGNVISGNLGRGIEVRGDTLGSTVIGANVIQGNIIGLDYMGENAVAPPNVAPPTVLPPNIGDFTVGNLSDGIFLLVPGNTTIGGTVGASISAGNIISNNRAAGIHAATQANGSATTGTLVILGNYIGTNVTGESVSDSNNPTVSLGNGSDGVFLDSINSGATIGETIAGPNGAVALGNVISGNRADGIDLLNSSNVVIEGNLIGTNVTGDNQPKTEGGDFGNSSNGVFINQSDDVTIGGTVGATIGGTFGGMIGASNIISGNHASGLYISGTSANPAYGNLIINNYIGTDRTGTMAIPNSDVGIALSDASGKLGMNTMGGTVIMRRNVISDNVISANLLDGILLANTAQYNSISGNTIGLSQSGSQSLPNTADGVFLLGGNGTVGSVNSTLGGTISGNIISSNTISGITKMAFRSSAPERMRTPCWTISSA